MQQPLSKLWISLLIVGVPMLVLAGWAIWLVVTSRPDVPLWKDGAIENGPLAVGLLLLGVLAWALVQALSRIAQRVLD